MGLLKCKFAIAGVGGSESRMSGNSGDRSSLFRLQDKTGWNTTKDDEHRESSR